MAFSHCMHEMTERKAAASRKGGEADIALLVLAETATGSALLSDLDAAGISLKPDAVLGTPLHYDAANKVMAVAARGHDPFRLALEIVREGVPALIAERKGACPLVDALDRDDVAPSGLSPEKASSLGRALGAFPQRRTWTGFSPEDEVAHEMAVEATSGMAMIAFAMELAERGRPGAMVRLGKSRAAYQVAALMESVAVKKGGVRAWREGASEASLRGFLSRPGCIGGGISRFRQKFFAHGQVVPAIARDYALLEMKNGGFLRPGAASFASVCQLPGGIPLADGEEARALFSDAAVEARQTNARLSGSLRDIRRAMEDAKPALEKMSAREGAGMSASVPQPHHAGDGGLVQGRTRKGGKR